jgi:pSer/pThr/pTyr-binding forkhead associated (FHA) protein
MAKLILSLDGMVLKEYPLTKERTTIGRKSHNDIVIDNLAVSGEHAMIMTILNDSFLEDLGSTNGTLVNNQPIKKHFLQNNDVVELGKYKLKYVNEAVAQAPNEDLEKTVVMRVPPGGIAKGETAAKSPEVSQPLPKNFGDTVVNPELMKSQGANRGAMRDAARQAAAAGVASAPTASAPSTMAGAAASGAPTVPAAATTPVTPPVSASAAVSAAPASAATPTPVANSLSAANPASATNPAPAANLASAANPAPAAPASPGTPLATASAMPDMPTAPLTLKPGPAAAAAAAAATTHPGGAAAATGVQGTIQILSGPSAGKELPLSKPLTTLGKPGVQVAVIAKRPQGYFITHVEGASFPVVNGKQLDAQAHPLSDHDVIELAGVKMEFFLKPAG